MLEITSTCSPISTARKRERYLNKYQRKFLGWESETTVMMTIVVVVAFIGKMGRGQIQFDGNSGEIKSASYNDPSLAGMRIDVDDGIIDMRGIGKTETESNYEEILLKDPNDKRQAWRPKHYYYKNNNGEYVWDNTQWMVNRQYYYAIEDSNNNIVYKEIDVGPADLAYRVPY